MLSSGYSLGDAMTDALAGFTVALCVIPQSIAMAIIAELPPQVSTLLHLTLPRTWQRPMSEPILRAVVVCDLGQGPIL
jgi:ABC-type branched-subunit amino acid transport system permease subunit